jgi:hypothetical protein
MDGVMTAERVQLIPSSFAQRALGADPLAPQLLSLVAAIELLAATARSIVPEPL